MKATYRVDKEGAGTRLDAWLAQQLPGVSRSRVQKWIKAGSVLRNGEKDTPHAALEEGDEIAVDAVDAPDADAPLVPRHDIPLEIVYEDEHVVVVNKPSGLIVHPAVPGESETLANALIAKYPEIAKIGDAHDRPGIVHRLDREASGLLVVARTPAAFANLKSQFQSHVVKKEYAVLIDGEPPQDEGTIRLAIGR
ncbi:MAG TPA: RluA family pseudouridine synthase, partial [Candidatus Binatia bacterium]|nr:RluA family pseudouridine synthase [Candidatus Binatia bacterium]